MHTLSDVGALASRASLKAQLLWLMLDVTCKAFQLAQPCQLVVIGSFHLVRGLE